MNTILQSVRRGKLDKQTADRMKRLAKNKMERAISDHTYAKTDYEAEMTQEALYTGPRVKTTLAKNIVNYGAHSSGDFCTDYATFVAEKQAVYTSSGVA